VARRQRRRSAALLGQRIPTFERLAPSLTALARISTRARSSDDEHRDTAGLLRDRPGHRVLLDDGGSAVRTTAGLADRGREKARALNAWHEIESKLGGFMRGQALAMVFIAVASAIGYAQIGLPNVLALGVLAGLLEAVPWIGPVLAVGPALLVALPMGNNEVLLVMALALLLQLLENNVLILASCNARSASARSSACSPSSRSARSTASSRADRHPDGGRDPGAARLAGGQRRGSRAAGRARRQPLDRLAHARRVHSPAGPRRLRSRSSRMGIDPGVADHVVDALDQQIEVAVARVEKVISAVETIPEAAGGRCAGRDRREAAQRDVAHRAGGRAHRRERGCGRRSRWRRTGPGREGFEEAVQSAESLVIGATEPPPQSSRP